MERGTWAVAAAGALVWAGAVLALRAGEQTGYALDDPYIHLSIARHVVEDGVWGVSPTHDAAASSSPLWTALLVGWFAAVGGSDLAPILLQLPVLLGAVAWLDRWHVGLPGARRAPWMAASLLLAGLPALLLTSMEHLLHATLALAVLELSARQLDGERRLGWLAVACGLAMGARYETAFLLLGTGAVLARAGRWRAIAAGHGAAGVVLGVSALHNLAVGVGPLPNSVIAKSAFIRSAGLADAVIGAVVGLPAHLAAHEPSLLGTLLLLLGAVVAVGGPHLREDPRLRVGVPAFALAVACQLGFAQLGWLFRYEAWLVLLGVALLARGIERGAPTSPVVRTLVAMAGLLLMVRLVWSTWAAVGALEDIRRQHLPMARLLAARFPGAVVVANDVGAISFYADVDVVDLVGLGDDELLEARRRGVWGPELLDRVARERGAALAVVYDAWFDGGARLPRSWRPVADWDVGTVTVAGSPVVSWYAIGASPDELREALERSPPAPGVELRWR